MSRTDTGTIARALRSGADDAAEAAAARFAKRAEAEGLVDVAYASFETPFGTGAVAATKRGVVSVGLPNRSLDEVLGQLADHVSPRVLESPARLDAVRRELDEYFAGSRHEFDLPLDWGLVVPGFGARVLKATARLPYGATATYGEIATKAGNPRAYRAAGTALGHNPLPLVVPCHRVLRAGGDIGNYGGGRPMKEGLLRLEGSVA